MVLLIGSAFLTDRLFGFLIIAKSSHSHNSLSASSFHELTRLLQLLHPLCFQGLYWLQDLLCCTYSGIKWYGRFAYFLCTCLPWSQFVSKMCSSRRQLVIQMHFEDRMNQVMRVCSSFRVWCLCGLNILGCTVAWQELGCPHASLGNAEPGSYIIQAQAYLEGCEPVDSRLSSWVYICGD